MGVGEDETLGDAISVTIIATGFDVEQQNEIVNTEPKKIIHTLEDEQKSVHDLTKKIIPAFNWDMEKPATNNTTERVIFELVEDEVTTPEIVAPEVVSINKEELIVMSEFIKNLDVTFEIVSPINDLDFIVSTSPEINEMKVVEPKIFEKHEQATFSFDLPIPTITKTTEPVQAPEKTNLFELTNETRDITVNEAVEFVPVTELTDKGIIRYSLEEFTEEEMTPTISKPILAAVEEVIPEELNITVKQVETVATATTPFDAISPLEMTIEETLKFRADERRRKLKDFNYKFHNTISRVDELEKEPAYKRHGIDLSASQSNNQNSRFSVGTDSNNDTQVRLNNSYLHDNVD